MGRLACLCVRVRPEVVATANVTTDCQGNKGSLPFETVSGSIRPLSRFQAEYGRSQHRVERRGHAPSKPVGPRRSRNRFSLAIQARVDRLLAGVYLGELAEPVGMQILEIICDSAVVSGGWWRVAAARSRESSLGRAGRAGHSSGGKNRSGSSCENVITRSLPRSRTCVRISPLRTAFSSMSWVCWSSES